MFFLSLSFSFLFRALKSGCQVDRLVPPAGSRVFFSLAWFSLVFCACVLCAVPSLPFLLTCCGAHVQKFVSGVLLRVSCSLHVWAWLQQLCPEADLSWVQAAGGSRPELLSGRSSADLCSWVGCQTLCILPRWVLGVSAIPKPSPSFGASGNHVSRPRRPLLRRAFLSVEIGFRRCDLGACLLQPAVLVAVGGVVSAGHLPPPGTWRVSLGRGADCPMPAAPPGLSIPVVRGDPLQLCRGEGDRSCLVGPWVDSWVLRGCCQPPTQRGGGLLCFLQAHVPCLHS